MILRCNLSGLVGTKALKLDEERMFGKKWRQRI